MPITKLLIGGLTGVGKTSLATQLAISEGWKYVSGSKIRRQLYNLNHSDRSAWLHDAVNIKLDADRMAKGMQYDMEVETRLNHIATSHNFVVIDSWFFPWIWKDEKTLTVFLSCSQSIRKSRVLKQLKNRNLADGSFEKKDARSIDFGLAAYDIDIRKANENFDIEIDTEIEDLDSSAKIVLDEISKRNV